VDFMLQQVLGPDYLRVDDQATPDQSRDISSLDVVTQGATTVLRERGAQAARRMLGDSRYAVFKSHIAAKPTFYHGPRKNVEVTTCRT
jgi:hypothetical protein